MKNYLLDHQRHFENSFVLLDKSQNEQVNDDIHDLDLLNIWCYQVGYVAVNVSFSNVPFAQIVVLKRSHFCWKAC